MKGEEHKSSATACADRAAREAAARPPPEKAAPLPPSGFAVAGSRKDWTEGKGSSLPSGRSQQTQEHRAMTADTELDLFRAQVNCGAVLEAGSPRKHSPCPEIPP